ncbi:gamma-aminobutyric acid type B receptor subunit 1-like [Gigantopelta aegis]|uniref:gamma-aminobutyric acid type B receptor subunit 1-like n=1 Tax=Gigantopelta aegis TaxID=1735272 RepID=UPI001B8894E0|nr:gamma-aminobutyric acid type B receptor subunit 1-like [Gigantopelta aegis]
MDVPMILAIAALVGNSLPGATSVKNIYFIGLLPFDGVWNGGQAILTGIQIALDQIKEREDVLPGYRINILWNNSKCDPGEGLNAMFHHLYTPPTKIMIIGGICSLVSEATAMVSYRWNVVQVGRSFEVVSIQLFSQYVVERSKASKLSPGSVSPALSDKTIFKKFLRTNSPESDINPTRINIFKAFGWSKIATIHQPYPLFSVSTDHLLRLMKQNGLEIVRSEIIGENPAIQLQKIKDHGARIIVGSFYGDMAVRIFCEAYKIGLYGPQIVWFIPAWYKKDWWKIRYPSVTCTEEQMREAVDGYFTVSRIHVNPKPEMTVSGYTPQKVEEMYWNQVNRSLPYNDLGIIGYDAIWTAALALNKTVADLKNNGLHNIEDFTYDDETTADILFNNALNLDFYGVQGRIRFNKNGDLTGRKLIVVPHLKYVEKKGLKALNI